MENDPTQIDRIQQYLRRITPQARRNLLVEIERMQMCGEDMPCSDIILAELRTEFHVLESCKRHPHAAAHGMLTSLRGMLGLGHRPGA